MRSVTAGSGITHGRVVRQIGKTSRLLAFVKQVFNFALLSQPVHVMSSTKMSSMYPEYLAGNCREGESDKER